MSKNKQYMAGLYCRLSKDDDQDGESISISTQKAILEDYCQKNDYQIYKFYIDDGFSGLNFNRPSFKDMIQDAENGVINMIVTKDLSRLGRDYIMTGYYSEIYFRDNGIRYIAIGDNYDTEKSDNDIAPFKNILNEMYAKDISRKIKAAKHQLAKRGQFVGSQAPYGYKKDPNNKSHLVVDPVAAEGVKAIFLLAEQGRGNKSIAVELHSMRIIAPAALKFRNHNLQFAKYPSVAGGDPYLWNHETVGQILSNPVYTGTLYSLKTEVVNCKTKKYVRTPVEQQIITPNAHEAIISKAQFERIQTLRKQHVCPANLHRFNLFRGKLFCACCGHPLAISKKQLKGGIADMYLCMYHYLHPEVCPQTHRIYHDMLYPYVLQQVRLFAKSMQKRKINAPISRYTDVAELTPEVLEDVIERIEISHVANKSRPGKVIQIYWKLK